MSLGQLVLELKLDGNQFTVNLKQAQGQLGQFVLGAQRANSAIKQAESGTRKWGSVIRDTVIGLALARDAVRTLADVTFGWQKAIIGANSEMEKSIALMKNFSKQKDPMVATQEAVGDVTKLLARASTSPFNLTSITDAFVKLRVGGVEPVFKSLDTLVDSVAAFGGSGENLKRAGVAIQQMAGKGVVSMEELRQQLGESVPTAINAMADALGTSYSKLVKEISQGKVTSKPAILAMMQELERSFGGSAAAMMDTWGGAVAQFETGMKKLAVAFGGLDKDGFQADGYLKTVTNELKGLNDVLSSPEMIQSARELGKSLADLIKTVASGTKWIIEHREAIYEWGKALLYLWAGFKGATIIGSVLTSVGATMSALSMKMIQMRMQGQGVITTMAGMAGSFSGWNSAAAIAAGGATRIATGSTAAGTAVRLLGGALGVIAGPIGLVAGLAISGGLAWYEYKKGVNEAEKAVLGLQGALTTMSQLQTLGGVKERMQEDFNDKFGKGNFTIGMQGDFLNIGEYKKKRQEALDEMAKVDADMLKGRESVAETAANQIANVEIQANSKALGEISRKYVIDKEAVRKKMEDEAKKAGKKVDEDALAVAFVAEQKKRVEAEITLYEDAIKRTEAAQKELAPNNGKSGEPGDVEQLAKVKAAGKALDEYRLKVSEARDALQTLGKVGLKDTLIDPGAKKGKPEFDAMSIFVDGLRKKLATLDAKIEETNPYLAQLDATIESLGGKKLPNFDKVLAEGTKLAEQTWVLEKAQKAAKVAADEYKDAQERIGQISALITAKMSKAENLNPWEKASADAVRYEEELDDMMEKLEKAKKAAYDAQVSGHGDGLLKKLEGEAVAAAASVEELKAKIESLKVSDTAKKMTQDSQEIADSLLSGTERVKVEYDRQTAWADQFYANHQAQLAQDGAAEAAYNEYRKQLNAQYQRDTESGLDAWIRQNKDATDQYKSLWGSAMDKFTDTLVDGLANGKLEFAGFVEYILKEFLRIQVAKQMAMLAESVGGSGGSGILGALFNGAMSWAGGAGASGGGNGMAAGSAGAVSSNLGASQAGYSSKYFANGGIMTEYGELALKKYAKGGVAREPQVAIYGEGSGAEAYVPLPDGRSIPVTMSGGAASGAGSSPTGAVPVEVNIYNQGGEQVGADSSSSFDGEKMVIDVVLSQLSKPSAMRTAVKGVV